MRLLPLAFAFSSLITSLVGAAPVPPINQGCLVELKKHPEAFKYHRPTASDFTNCPPSGSEAQVPAAPIQLDAGNDTSSTNRRRNFNPSFAEVVVDFSDRTVQSLAYKSAKHAVFGTPFIPSKPGTDPVAQVGGNDESKAGGSDTGKN